MMGVVGGWWVMVWAMARYSSSMGSMWWEWKAWEKVRVLVLWPWWWRCWVGVGGGGRGGVGGGGGVGGWWVMVWAMARYSSSMGTMWWEWKAWETVRVLVLWPWWWRCWARVWVGWWSPEMTREVGVLM